MSDFQPTQRSRRCYHRVISGIERGGQLRFLTLTSSNDSPETCQRSWRVLYMRLKRRHLLEGYIKVPELSKNGKQHLHVLFRGSYISQVLLSQWWQEIHQAKVVGIARLNYRKRKGDLAAYMAKYMSKSNIYRYSWNWGWVWRGFCRDWKNLKRWWRNEVNTGRRDDFKICIKLWAWWLQNKWKPPPEVANPPNKWKL